MDDNIIIASKTFVPKSKLPSKPKPDFSASAVGRIATPPEIVPGLRIYHLKFGYGTVAKVDGSGEDRKAIVTFETLGQKVLLLKFAKLIIPKDSGKK